MIDGGLSKLVHKEENNGTDNLDCSYFAFVGSISLMAIQPKLGILAQRWPRAGRSNSLDSVTSGKNLERLLILFRCFPALGDVPQHAGWIHDKRDPKSPRLQRRRFWRRNPEVVREIE